MTRWGSSYGAWEANVNIVLEFVEDRLGYVWQHYINEFNLEKLVTIGLDIDSIIHGNVKINTIIPDSLPWQGLYFDGNAVDIAAIPDSGYIFSHWASNMIISGADTIKQNLLINVDTNDVFKAFFVIDTLEIDTPLIVFNEINYRSVDSLDADDWVELWNIDTVSRDLSDWIFKDGDDTHEFILPPQTILDTGQYLVLCQDTTKFENVYPEVYNVVGPLNFGLAREEEQLRLFDSTGFLIVSMAYSNQPPWTIEADGTGKTLELIDPFGDMNDPANWFAGCFGGSPGGPFVPCDTIGIDESVGNNIFVKVYPNPFEEKTTIELWLEEPQKLEFKVYDVFGNLVEQLTFSFKQKGINRFVFNNRNLNNGLFFFRLSGKNFDIRNKLIIK